MNPESKEDNPKFSVCFFELSTFLESDDFVNSCNSNLNDMDNLMTEPNDEEEVLSNPKIIETVGNGHMSQVNSKGTAFTDQDPRFVATPNSGGFEDPIESEEYAEYGD